MEMRAVTASRQNLGGTKDSPISRGGLGVLDANDRSFLCEGDLTDISNKRVFV
jgi:hypothetical protein